MAVTFSDLHTESGLKSLNEFLSGKTYISGDQLTKDDIKVYAFVNSTSDTFPNSRKWYDAVSSRLAESFPGKAQGVSFSGQATPAEADPAKLAYIINMVEELYRLTINTRATCSNPNCIEFRDTVARCLRKMLLLLRKQQFDITPQPPLPASELLRPQIPLQRPSSHLSIISLCY